MNNKISRITTLPPKCKRLDADSVTLGEILKELQSINKKLDAVTSSNEMSLPLKLDSEQFVSLLKGFR